MNSNQASLHLAKTHSYEQLRYLANCVLGAMSLHITSYAEKLAKDRQADPRDLEQALMALQMLSKEIAAMSMSTGNIAMPKGRDINSSDEELTHTSELIKQAMSPEVMELNKLYYNSPG